MTRPFHPADFPVPEALNLIRLALEEDVGPGDYTTLWTIPTTTQSKAVLIAKQDGVLCGMDIARLVFDQLQSPVEIDLLSEDGQSVRSGQHIAEITGPTQALLTGERTLLNLMQQLSGTASVTAHYAQALAAKGSTQVLDTRKTLPGWRRLQKYAVRCGGGSNHRMGLHDMILIKDNHIAACGGAIAAVLAVRKQNSLGLKIEIEVEDLETLDSLLDKGVDRILLDNMNDAMLREAVQLVRSSAYAHIELEASGNMDLNRVTALADAGLNFISVGALTHSVPAFDISMRIP